MKTSQQILNNRNDFEWQVASKTHEGKFWIVGWHNERWYCSCPAGMMNRKCRHVRIVKNEIKGIIYP